MKNNWNFFQKLKMYRLINNAYVICILIVITILSICLYLIPSVYSNEALSNIMLAIFTSFAASIVAMCAETYIQYRLAERDEFLHDIHAFGITKLNKNKEEAIRTLLKTCRNDLWISGYRLIMTDSLVDDIVAAVKRQKIKIRILACPPWENAYKLVYGEEEVMNHYFNIIISILNAIRDSGKTELCDIDIRFIDKPFFSDTYRVDDCLISGPYMHNKIDNARITAKDFFSYNLLDSPLYNLINVEYETLWNDYCEKLNIEKFLNACHNLQWTSLTEKEKIAFLKDNIDLKASTNILEEIK